MINMIKEKSDIHVQELHSLKQTGELYRWKEEYKKDNLPMYYEVSKHESLLTIFKYICKNIGINIGEKERFVYFLDYIYLLDEVRGHQFGNITPDYVTFINEGIKGLRNDDVTSNYTKDYEETIDSIVVLIDRICEELKVSSTNNKEKKIKWFELMKEAGAEHFEEALQRILFVNQVIWQTDHRLIGIGAIDDYLDDLYQKDINSGYITYDEAKDILKDFIITLHGYYWLKSNMLLGDTGQIFVLGGTKENGEYKYSDLTIMLINIIMELRLPDPKILLRVDENTPDEVLDLAIECMSTGVGSPLLSNDKVILPRLLEFGIEKEDAHNYTVSACWEPLIGGKSVSLNNMTTLNFMRALDNLFKRDNLSKIDTFDKLLERYEFYLERNIRAVKRVIDNAKFQYDTVMSVFIEDCKEKDASMGGAKYLDAGITTVALGNVVDSLINIKKYVFEKKTITLFDVKRSLIYNFEEDGDILTQIRNNKKMYGIDDEESINITNYITKIVSKYTKDYRTPYGGKLKFGVSAPTYVEGAIGSGASFDGRKEGDAYLVHISNEEASSYTEVINFAAALDYGENRFNGNVVDLMINPTFMTENRDKIIALIKGAIRQGFFQMQINVVSSDTLIEASKHPEEYNDLIVRVWGFSAYFVDLPNQYKEVLIRRALKNEGKLGNR